MTVPRIRPLTASGLTTIGDPCGHCGHGLYVPHRRPDPLRTHPNRNDVRHRNGNGRPGRNRDRTPDGYTAEVTELWGLCGVATHLNGDVPAYLCFAPSELVPPIPLPAPGGTSADAFDPDAAVLTALSVCRIYRNRGFAKDLVRVAAAQLARRQFGIIEVLGTVGPPAEPYVDGLSRDGVDGLSRDGTDGLSRDGTDGSPNRADGRSQPLTLLPVGFWRSMGFRVVRPHPITPTLRMDIATTARWLPDLTAAWQRFTRLVTQPGPPQPASFSDPQLNLSRQPDPTP